MTNKNNDKYWAKRALSLMDLTSLNDDDTELLFVFIPHLFKRLKKH